jgi:GNAT superfamily N-acetyltransferase
MTDVRLATIEDIDSLLPLTRAFHHAAGFQKYSEWDANKAAKWLNVCVDHTSATCLVATNGNQVPVGFLTAIMVPAFWDPDIVVCQENLLWVVPEQRQNGVGATLIEKMIAWAEENRCKIVAVSAQQSLQPKKTALMYKKLGFELAEKAFARRI